MNLIKYYRRFRKKNKAKYFISHPNDLGKLSSNLENCKIIGLDTEFDWRTTYFPVLSLIQISTHDHIYLIDCLKINPAKILKKYLESKDILKIFHSARSDATVLSKCLNIYSENIFDIQMAEKLLQGDIKSYSKIVNKYFGILLNKSETNSNWLKRPLSVNQINYASDDVNFLIEIFYLQKRILIKKKLLKKSFELSEKESNLGNQSLEITRLKRLENKLSKRSLKVFLWREKIAEEKNVPPSFIFKDKYISKLTKINENNNDSKRKVMKIVGDSQLADNFVLNFL